MPRPSPQTDRVVATIELLAASDDGLTLSELGRALSVNVSSCVHLLAALATAGWVVRDPDDRRYHLGPALAEPGARAAARHPDLVAARPEMAALADAVELPCLAFRPEGGSARLVQATWPRGSAAPPIRLGDTVPIVPPLGALYLAWAGPAAVAAWVGRDPSAVPAAPAAVEAQLAAIRRDGYAVELEPAAAPAALAAAVDDRPSPYRDGRVWSLLTEHGAGDRLLVDLDARRSYAVQGISAPVFRGGRVGDRSGTPVLGLYVVGFAAPVVGERIGELGAVVRAAAERAGARL